MTAIHKDLENADQTIVFPDIKTTAVDEETGILTGGAVLRAVFSERYDGLPVYFAAKANKEIKSCTITGDETNLIADLNFGSLENESVELKVAVSFVSEGASLVTVCPRLLRRS